MEVSCHHCGKAQNVPPEAFANQNKIQVTCGSCGSQFQVTNPKVSTLRLETTRKKVQAVTEEVSPEGRALSLPKDRDLGLRILQGPERGGVYPIHKPRVTIGRTNADINVDDPLVSRLHCALEISGEEVLLRDLGSSNGTLMDNKLIETAKLSSGASFQIGGHIFQLVVNPKTS